MHLGVLATGMILQRFRRLPFLGSRWPSRVAGVLAIGSGLALATWATVAARSTSLDRPAAVLASGPYAFARHPMYVAWTMIVAGAAMWRDNGWLAAGLVPLAVAIDAEARGEERRLVESLGSDYVRYAGNVGRYGPWGRARAERSSARDRVVVSER